MDSAYNLREEIKRKYNSAKNQEKDLESVLFSKGTKRSNFFTDDSCLYFDCGDKKTERIIKFRSKNKFFDSLNSRVLDDYKKFRGGYNDFLWVKYRNAAIRLNQYQNQFEDGRNYFLEKISVVRLWNASILVAIVIGMMSMSLIYRYLGQGVDAKSENNGKPAAEIVVENKKEEKWTKEKEDEYIKSLENYLKIEADKDFNKKVKELVKGYPIEDFLPYLLNKDHEVVSFYIAIAKKESNWGKRVPVLNGEDCYNYVGYRGGGDRLGSGGHSCFINRKEAVDVVSKRIEALIKDYGRDTAKEMVVWKCGNNCAITGGQAAANKWIADVDGILSELKKAK